MGNTDGMQKRSAEPRQNLGLPGISLPLPTAVPELLKRPLLVGGVGLSATLALVGMVHGSLFDSSTLLSALALGSGIWWWRRGDSTPDRTTADPKPVAPPVVDRSRVERELASLNHLIDALAQELMLASKPGDGSDSVSNYRQAHQALVADLDRDRIQVAIAGDPRTGKTTLLNLLTAARLTADSLAFTEVPLVAGANPDWLNYDGVLLVTDGDITASALALLKERVIGGQAAVLVFNRQDHYDLADQQTILTRLQQQVATLPVPVTVPVPVVATAAAPRAIKVRRHQSDGTMSETMETPAPVIAALTTTLETALVTHRSTLVAATALRRTQALGQRLQTDINRLRRDRALPVIEQLQWVAGAAAFANPVPTLDLLATVAINAQLILDLGKVYGFSLNLDEAKTAAGTLASLTVKLGLVELSTQGLTAVLKSHFATYLAGGLVQGLSAAYLTRMAGLSLVDYFEQAALVGTPAADLSWASLGQRLKDAVLPNRQGGLLKTLAKQGIEILKPTPAQLPASPASALELDTFAVGAEPVSVEVTSLG